MTVAIGADKHRAAKSAARGQAVQIESGPKRNTACENTFAINFAKLRQMHARKKLYGDEFTTLGLDRVSCVYCSSNLH